MPDLCALVDLTLVRQQGFELRDRIPFAGSATSSCTIVLRLADAPPLDRDTILDPSRELVAVRAEAESSEKDPQYAERTWQARRASLSRGPRYDDQKMRQVVGSERKRSRPAKRSRLPADAEPGRTACISGTTTCICTSRSPASATAADSPTPTPGQQPPR